MVPTFSKSIQHSHNFHLLAIAFFTSIILFTSLHKGGLSGFDDAIYAHEAKQMLVTGDWWNVRFNGGLNFQYPPLFIWLDALSMRVLGITDFAAKFPSAVLSLGTVLLVFLIVRRLSDDFWLPICAAWVLMLSQYFMKYSLHAMTDVPFTFFVTLSIYLYLRGIERHWYWIPSGLSIGMGILTRSILGLIPAAIIVSHLIYTRRGWVLRKSQFWAGALLAVLLPALWFGVQYSLYGPQFIAGHFSFVTSKLTTTGGFGAGHFLRGLLVYPWLLLQLYWPWLPFMVAGLVSQTRVMFRSREDLAALSILSVVMVMGPFSLVDAKVLRYIMLAFPAFAILSAVSLNSAIGLKRARPVATFVALCTIALLAAIFAKPGTTPRKCNNWRR